MSIKNWTLIAISFLSLHAFSAPFGPPKSDVCKKLLEDQFEKRLEERLIYRRIHDFFREKFFTSLNQQATKEIDSYFAHIDQDNSTLQIEKVVQDLRNLIKPFESELAASLSNFVETRSERLSRQIHDLLVGSGNQSRLLDVGCADGNMLCGLKKLNGDASLFGLDVFPMNPKPTEFTYYRVDPTNTLFPVRPQSMDAITLIMVLHHESAFEQLICEAHRALKKNGLLIVKEHNAETESDARYFEYRDRILSQVLFQNNFIRIGEYRSLQSWIDVISRYGFVLDNQLVTGTEDGF